MARKPFLPKYRNTAWWLGPDIAHPNLLALIARSIMEWAYVEHNLALILGWVLGANSAPALAIFTVLRQGRAQHRAIIAAAEAGQMPTHDLDLMQAVLQFVATAEKSRNDLVHGQWGTMAHGSYWDRQPVARPDCLIWVEAKQVAPWNVKVIFGHKESDPDVPNHRDLEKVMFVYEQADLEEALNLIQRAKSASHTLMSFIQLSAEDERRPELRETMCSEPQIQVALDRLTASRTK